MHTTTFYPGRANITIDLWLHVLTAYLTFRSNQKNRWVQCYLVLVFLGCIIAALHSLTLDPESGVHTWPIITLFPTLSVIHFSVVNIWGDKIPSWRTLMESTFTLFLFFGLVSDWIKVDMFRSCFYSELYFFCSAASAWLCRILQVSYHQASHWA